MKINILTNPRSGSTYFYNMLCRFYTPYQPFTRWNEVFNLHERKPIHDIDQIIHDAKHHTDVVAKNHVTFFNFVEEDHLKKFFDIGWYNLVLLRRNFFETSLSLAKSKVTNQWTSYNNNVVVVPENILKESMDEIFLNVKNLIHNIWQVPYHEIVYYEDLTFDHKDDFELLKLSKSYNYEQYKIWYPEINPYKKSVNINAAPDKRNTVKNYNELVQFASEEYSGYKSKRFIIKDGFIRRINWDTQYIDIDNF